MLNELSKKDAQWRKMALYICKDKDLADDIANDMYIKAHTWEKKFNEIDEGYVFRVMKNIYLHYLRKQKQMLTIEFKDTLNDMPNHDEEILKNRQLMHRALYELDFFDRHILLHTSERSLRKTQEYLNISVDVLFYSRKKALERLKQTPIIKRYKSA